jgi:hypothetical protein
MEDPTDRAADPAAQTQWELWYQDTFDRQAPRQVEARGEGLAAGLRALWARHLLEGVTEAGQAGFARFNLWLPAREQALSLPTDHPALVRLRAWLYPPGAAAAQEPFQAADHHLLALIAAAHARLLAQGRTAEPILRAAAEAADGKALAVWLRGAIQSGA